MQNPNFDAKAIKQVASDDLLATVLRGVDDLLHIITFTSRSSFCEKPKVSDLLANLCTSLIEMYMYIPSVAKSFDLSARVVLAVQFHASGKYHRYS